MKRRVRLLCAAALTAAVISVWGTGPSPASAGTRRTAATEMAAEAETVPETATVAAPGASMEAVKVAAPAAETVLLPGTDPGTEPEPATADADAGPYAGEITAEIRMDGGPAADGRYYYRADNCGIRVLFYGDPEQLRASAPAAEIDGRPETRRYAGACGSEGILAAVYSPEETASLLSDGTHVVRVLTEGREAEAGIASCAVSGVGPDGSFVLDTAPPAAVWEVSSPDSLRQELSGSGNRYYFSADFAVRVTVLEENAAEGSLWCRRGEVRSGEYDASTAEIREFPADLLPEREGEAVVFGDAVSSDGVYRYQAGGCDLAGNPLVLAGGFGEGGLSPHVVRDATPPRGVVSVLENGSVCWRMDDYGRVIYAEPYRAAKLLEVEFRSDTSAEHSPVTLLGSVLADGEEYVTEEKGFRYACAGRITVNGGCAFRTDRFEMEDLAGNRTCGMPSGFIYSDLAAPEIVLLCAAREPSCADGSLYNTDVPVRIVARDPAGNGSTGIGDVTVKVFEDGSDAPSEEIVLHRAVRRAFEGNYEEEKKQQELEDVFVIGRQHCSDRISLRVTVSDNAGNTGTAGLSFGIDSEPPRVRVVYEDDPEGSGEYFRGDRTARITVTERHFDESRFLVEAGGGEVSGWSPRGGAWECTALFTGEGEHTLSVSGTDTAGNAAETVFEGEAARHFVIDRTPPVLRLRYEYPEDPPGREKIETGGVMYVREPAAVLLEVRDSGFGGDAEGLAVRVPGGETEACGFEGRVLRIPFSGEGVYSLGGVVRDLAGNTSAVLPETVWIVDRTPPAVGFAGAEDGASLRELPKIQIRVADANPDAGGIRIRREPSSGAPGDLKFVTESAEGAVVCVPEIPAEDGFCRILCEARDLAGNEGRGELAFTLNRRGPVFTPLEPAAPDAVLPGPVRPAVRIGDVDPVRILSAGINGSETTGRMEGDVLRIGEEITEEGKYVLTVTVKDTAGHVAEMEPLEFEVDRTPPVLRAEIEGGEKRKYTERVKIVLTSDDREASFSKLTLDGRDILGECALEGGRAEILIPPESRGRHRLTAAARDAAGNEGEAVSVSVSMAGDLPGIFLLILLAAAAAALAAFRLRERRRRA